MCLATGNCLVNINQTILDDFLLKNKQCQMRKNLPYHKYKFLTQHVLVFNELFMNTNQYQQ